MGEEQQNKREITRKKRKGKNSRGRTGGEKMAGEREEEERNADQTFAGLNHTVRLKVQAGHSRGGESGRDPQVASAGTPLWPQADQALSSAPSQRLATER